MHMCPMAYSNDSTLHRGQPEADLTGGGHG
ncbi:hypothetical protein ES707_14070 [subsurface metagenome]